MVYLEPDEYMISYYMLFDVVTLSNVVFDKYCKNNNITFKILSDRIGLCFEMSGMDRKDLKIFIRLQS